MQSIWSGPEQLKLFSVHSLYGVMANVPQQVTKPFREQQPWRDADDRYLSKQSVNRRAYRSSCAVAPGKDLVETARRCARANGGDAQLSGIASIWPTKIKSEF
jgi:hypothetical protein